MLPLHPGTANQQKRRRIVSKHAH
jgi:hypothetical protein